VGGDAHLVEKFRDPLSLADHGGQVTLQIGIGVAALKEIAVADDRLQRAVDLRRDSQRQIRHGLDRPVPAERHLELLCHDGYGEEFGNRQDRLRVLGQERVSLSRHEIQRADGAAFRHERHHQHRAESGGLQDVGIEEIARHLRDIGHDDRLARPDHVAEQRAVGLEDDLRARTRSPLLFVHPRGVGLELLAGFVEQRQADAIAGHQPRDA
jgi:hypothetical protein